MTVRIRLTRMGSKRRPFYRFVVADSRGKRDGGFLEQIGHYNPISTPHELKVDEDKVFDWLKKGAELSDGARGLLKKHGTLRKWDAVRRGLPIPPDPEKVIEVQAKEPDPAETPETTEAAGAPEIPETPKPVETPETPKPAEPPVIAKAAEAPEAKAAPEPAEPPVTAKPAEAPEAKAAPEPAEPPVIAKAPESPETPEAPEKPEETTTS